MEHVPADPERGVRRVEDDEVALAILGIAGEDLVYQVPVRVEDGETAAVTKIFED